jgi:hypothetical protein
MRSSFGAVAIFLFVLASTGCSPWQANKASEAIEINPFAGSGDSFLSPANGPGFVNGEAQDARTRR